jgi:acyl carrier protein
MDELKAFIQNEIKTIAFKKVEMDESLIKSKVLDSIGVVDLIVAIEEKTGKQIPQHLVTDENFETINEIINTLSKVN